MSAIINWEYYNSLHLNPMVTTETFSHYEAIAEAEIRRVVGLPKWENIDSTTYGYDILKECISNVIDKIVTDEKSGRGNGLTSVSNDGYTESYAVQTSADLRNDMTTAIRGWLSGTGLVGAY